VLEPGQHWAGSWRRGPGAFDASCRARHRFDPVALARRRRCDSRALVDQVVFNSVHSVEAGERLASVNGRTRCTSREISRVPRIGERLIREVVAPVRPAQRAGETTRASTRKIAHKDLATAERPRSGVRSSRSMSLAPGISAWRRWRNYERPMAVIVNVSSIAGLRATGSSIPYATSKAAVNHMTRCSPRPWAPKSRVNAVAPRPH